MEMSCVMHSRMALWDLDLEPRTVVKWLQSSTKLTPIGVEEDPVADSYRGAGGAVRMHVLVMHLTNSTGYAGSEERLHEVDVGTDVGTGRRCLE